MNRATERVRGVKGVITALAGVVVLICITLLAPGQAFGQSLKWTQLVPTDGPPPARGGHTAVTDPLNNMIVFGGIPDNIGAPPMFNDVWVLTDSDGSGLASAWTQLLPLGAAPAGRARHSAVYDPNTNSMTIFGGDLAVGFCFAQSNDVWVLANANGAGGTPTWTQLAPAGALPTGRDGDPAVYDGANNRMMVFGGENGCFNPNAEIWVLANANGAGGTPTWTQLSPAAGAAPDARAFHSSVYDPGSNRTIIFGGITNTTYVNDVWVLTNANGLGGAPTWTQQQPTGGPPTPRYLHSAVFNLSTDRMTVFGGLDSANLGLNDTWVLAPSEPRTKQDCKDGGWMTLSGADGSPFKNQGDCIQFVNTGK